MNEIVARLGGLSFAVIRKNGGARSEKLARNVVSGARVWNQIDETDDIGRVSKQAIFQVEAVIGL